MFYHHVWKRFLFFNPAQFLFIFSWVLPILRLGNQREIEISDINAFLPENDSKELEYILEKYIYI